VNESQMGGGNPAWGELEGRGGGNGDCAKRHAAGEMPRHDTGRIPESQKGLRYERTARRAEREGDLSGGKGLQRVSAPNDLLLRKIHPNSRSQEIRSGSRKQGKGCRCRDRVSKRDKQEGLQFSADPTERKGTNLA